MAFSERISVANPDARFRELAEDICALLAAHGVSFRPSSDPALTIFSKLDIAKKETTLQALQRQKEFLEFAAKEGESPDSPKLIWRALTRMGLVPEADVFDKIEDGDIVEIYGDDGIGVFRNLTFFKFMSMTVEELYSLTVMGIAQMSPAGYLYFIEILVRLRLGSITKTFRPFYGRYYLTERFGEQRTFRIHLKWLSPVRSGGRRVALLAVNRTRFSSKDRPVGEW